MLFELFSSVIKNSVFVQISDLNLEAGGNLKLVPTFKGNALLMKTDSPHNFGVL